MRSHCFRLTLTAIAVCILVLAMAGCSKRAEAPPLDPPPVTLRVLLLPYDDYTPLQIAQDEGYFREQGLNVEFLKATTSAEFVPALIQGDLDVLVGALGLGLMNSIAKGAPLRIVAGSGVVRPGGRELKIVARPELITSGRLKTAKDLKGLRIGTAPGSTFDYYMYRILEKAGLAPDDVAMQKLDNWLAAEALLNGAIDVTLVGDRYLPKIFDTGAGALWSGHETGIDTLQLSVVVYGERLLRGDPDTGTRFMTAYLKAVRQLNEGKTPRNVELMVKHTGLSADLLQRIDWPILYDDGRLHSESVVGYQEWGVQHDLLDRVVGPEVFFDPQFIRKANEALNAGVP